MFKKILKRKKKQQPVVEPLKPIDIRELLSPEALEILYGNRFK